MNIFQDVDYNRSVITIVSDLNTIGIKNPQTKYFVIVAPELSGTIFINNACLSIYKNSLKNLYYVNKT